MKIKQKIDDLFVIRLTHRFCLMKSNTIYCLNKLHKIYISISLAKWVKSRGMPMCIVSTCTKLNKMHNKKPDWILMGFNKIFCKYKITSYNH